MTRQAFLARSSSFHGALSLPFCPPAISLYLSLSPSLLLSPLAAFAPASFPFSFPSLWSSLSTLSPEVSRDRVGWSLYFYRLLRSHIAERRAHVLPCSGPSRRRRRRRANREQTFMPLYIAGKRAHVGGRRETRRELMRASRTGKGTRKRGTGPCLVLPSICSVRQP